MVNKVDYNITNNALYRRYRKKTALD